MKTISKQRDRAALELRRLEAGKLFAKGTNQAEIARRFKVTTAAVCQWHSAWQRKGNDGLLSKGPSGIDPKLSDKKKERLRQLILKGPIKAGYTTDFWTISRIQDIIKKKLKIPLGTGTIWRTIVNLGFSCQKPERRSKERKEKMITDWKLKTFPKLKKMGL